MEIEYKIFYKMDGSNWKTFFFNADSDMEAIQFLRNWLTLNSPEKYGLEKIMKTRLI